MRSLRYRRSRHPLTTIIDAAIDARIAAGHTITTGLIANDLVSTVPAALMLTEFGRLIGDRVRTRMRQRGLMLTNDKTWDRKLDVDITNAEFGVTVDVKANHVLDCQARLKADRAVKRFLDTQAAKQGRPVTMGEYQRDVDRIYASYGY